MWLAPREKMLIDDFLRYESDLARSFLIPLLESMKISLSGKSILDVGCGYGGVLAALEERFGLSRSLGIEVDSEMVKMGLARNTTKIQLEVQNFFSL